MSRVPFTVQVKSTGESVSYREKASTTFGQLKEIIFEDMTFPIAHQVILNSTGEIMKDESTIEEAG